MERKNVLRKFVIVSLLAALVGVGFAVRVEPKPDTEVGECKSNISVENDIIIGNTLPDWMEVCTATGVYGDPYGRSPSLYALPVGEVVRVRDVNQDGTWVMVKPARWVPLGALCWCE